MSRTTRAKACWSLIVDDRFLMSPAALPSMNSRQRSSTLPADAGGFSPVSFSRTRSATASPSGASACRSIAAKFALAYFSSSMTLRFLATPAMRNAPIASTRACSTASKIARASAPAATSSRGCAHRDRPCAAPCCHRDRGSRKAPEASGAWKVPAGECARRSCPAARWRKRPPPRHRPRSIGCSRKAPA